MGRTSGFWPEFARWSSLDPDGGKLHPKMVLVVWVPTSFDADKRNVTLLDESQLVVVTRGSAEHMDLDAERMGRALLEKAVKHADVAPLDPVSFGGAVVALLLTLAVLALSAGDPPALIASAPTPAASGCPPRRAPTCSWP